jgi:hypothetical protein
VPASALEPADGAHLLIGQQRVGRTGGTPLVLPELLEHGGRGIPLRRPRGPVRRIGPFIAAVPTPHRAPGHEVLEQRFVISHQLLIDRYETVDLGRRQAEGRLVIEQSRNGVAHPAMHVVASGHRPELRHATVRIRAVATRGGCEWEYYAEDTKGFSERHGHTSTNGLGQVRSTNHYNAPPPFVGYA